MNYSLLLSHYSLSLSFSHVHSLTAALIIISLITNVDPSESASKQAVAT